MPETAVSSENIFLLSLSTLNWPFSHSGACTWKHCLYTSASPDLKFKTVEVYTSLFYCQGEDKHKVMNFCFKKQGEILRKWCWMYGVCMNCTDQGLCCKSEIGWMSSKKGFVSEPLPTVSFFVLHIKRIVGFSLLLLEIFLKTFKML